MWTSAITREALAECLGTFIFMAISDGSIAQALLSKGSEGSAFSIHISTGISVMMGVYVAGGISGGHINPAVTVAQAVFGRLPWWKVPYYLVGQYSGSFLASLLIYLVYNDALSHYDGGLRSTTGPTGTAGIWATYPQQYLSVTNSLLDQIFGSCVLLICVSAINDKRNMNPSPGLKPICIGLVVFVINTTYCLNCGCPNNPARDFSPRLFTVMAGWSVHPLSYKDYRYFWVPVIGPHIGAILGVFVYELFVGFHWSNEKAESTTYRSPVWVKRKIQKHRDSDFLDKFNDAEELLLETTI